MRNLSSIRHHLSSILQLPAFDFLHLTSYLYPLSSCLDPPSSILHPPTSYFLPLISYFRKGNRVIGYLSCIRVKEYTGKRDIQSSNFQLPASSFQPLSSIFYPPASDFLLLTSYILLPTSFYNNYHSER